MTALRNTGIGLVVFLGLQTLWPGTARSQQPANPAFSTEISRQESIYRGQAQQGVLDGYTVDRSLVDYTYALHSGFARALENLGPKDRWLDIGAGRGQAIVDYYNPGYEPGDPDGWERRRKKAQTVAISIEDGRTSFWQQTAASLEANKMQYLFNRRLREYSPEELGRFQVITDVLGGFSYTTNLSLFMDKVLGFLDLNGSFFAVLQDVRAEDGENRPHYPGSPFLTEIAGAEGSEMRVCSWLKSITCVEVACEFRARWTPPLEAYRVRKVCNDVTVPALAPIHYEAGTPPERRFRLIGAYGLPIDE